MDEMYQFEDMTLNEIELFGNKELMTRYDQEIAALEIDDISRIVINRKYGESINTIVREIEKASYEFELRHRSEILFPNELVEVYPRTREGRAKREITCDFSGARIKKGSLYVSYRPMVWSITNGDTYVLSRTIKVESGYAYDLPSTIAELESLNVKMLSHADSDNGIDYDHLYWQMGGELDFQKLKRRKKYESRIS
jgi:hypothetical protein